VLTKSILKSRNIHNLIDVAGEYVANQTELLKEK
jgi:hypothetical protein